MEVYSAKFAGRLVQKAIRGVLPTASALRFLNELEGVLTEYVDHVKSEAEAEASRGSASETKHLREAACVRNFLRGLQQ